MKWYRGTVLFTVFFTYLLLGGVIFKALESQTDITKDPMIAAIIQFQDKLLDVQSLRQAGITQFNWTTSVLSQFEDFNANYINQNKTVRWSFYDAIFFSLTVITSIGYGNKTPYNESGRGFCIIYALVGIPITGLWMAFLGDTFRKKLDRSFANYKGQSLGRFRLLVKIITVLIPGFIIFLILPAAVFVADEKWNFLDSFYYAVITLTTIGFGDYVAARGSQKFSCVYRAAVMLWIVFGLGYISMVLNLIARGMKSKRMKKVETLLINNFKNTQSAFVKEIDFIMKSISSAHMNLQIKDSNCASSSACQQVERGTPSLSSLSSRQGSVLEHTSPQPPDTNDVLLKLALALASRLNNKNVDQGQPSKEAVQLLANKLLPQLRSNWQHINENTPHSSSVSSLEAIQRIPFHCAKKRQLTRFHSLDI